MQRRDVFRWNNPIRPRLRVDPLFGASHKYEIDRMRRRTIYAPNDFPSARNTSSSVRRDATLEISGHTSHWETRASGIGTMGVHLESFWAARQWRNCETSRGLRKRRRNRIGRDLQPARSGRMSRRITHRPQVLHLHVTKDVLVWLGKTDVYTRVQDRPLSQ